MRVEEFYKIAKEHNVLVIQAHPFRDGICFPTKECVDGFEVFNSNPRHQDFSEKSKKCAIENDLYMIAGSDSHRIEDLGKSGILSDCEITSEEGFINLVKSGKFKILKG